MILSRFHHLGDGVRAEWGWMMRKDVAQSLDSLEKPEGSMRTAPPEAVRSEEVMQKDHRRSKDRKGPCQQSNAQ